MVKVRKVRVHGRAKPELLSCFAVGGTCRLFHLLPKPRDIQIGDEFDIVDADDIVLGDRALELDVMGQTDRQFRSPHYRCICISRSIGIIAWLRLVMMIMEPNTTKPTTKMPKASARKLLV